MRNTQRIKTDLSQIEASQFIISRITFFFESIFNQAEKNKGYIPLRGTINAQPYTQTLVKFSGLWRLYINTTMLKNSPKHVGETIEITIELDPSDRSIQPHPKLVLALTENPEAKNIFDKLPASRQHKIIRYIASLKTDESVEKKYHPCH